MKNKKYKLMYQDCEIVEQDCESSEWVELKEGCFFTQKPAFKRVPVGVVSTFNRPSKNKWVWFHSWLN
jgi:hypothetical protein